VWSRIRRRVRWVAKHTITGIGPPLLGLLARTWRIEQRGEAHLALGGDESGVLLAFWHGRMAIGMIPYRNCGYSVLVSHSKDGEVAHRLLRRLGFGTIRGSSSRGAPRALREMLRELREGRRVVLTPDGPRGPRHRMNDGVAWMARATGFAVVPIGMGANRAWVLGSWDAFMIPKPFARVVMVYGEPQYMHRSADEAEQRAFGERLRERMIALESGADAVARNERTLDDVARL
jgi:lysophospholipid acyltransferase (LPLAT)-like uncharacterized protein